MEYFRLRQDWDYINAPIIPDVIKQIDWRYVTPAKADKIQEITVFKLTNNDEIDALDLLDRQLLLFSRLLKDAVKLYLPKLNCKKVLLINSQKRTHMLYYLPLLEPVDCISDKSIMTPNKSMIKKLVLKADKMPKQAIFKVNHSHETIIIVRLDAAESIMRRKFHGLKRKPYQTAIAAGSQTVFYDKTITK
jgi:hypothetical protein